MFYLFPTLALLALTQDRLMSREEEEVAVGEQAPETSSLNTLAEIGLEHSQRTGS